MIIIGLVLLGLGGFMLAASMAGSQASRANQSRMRTIVTHQNTGYAGLCLVALSAIFIGFS